MSAVFRDSPGKRLRRPSWRPGDAPWWRGILLGAPLVGCGTPAAPTPDEVVVTAVGGGAQTGLVGDPLGFPLVVRVTSGGQPVSAQQVQWTVSSGSGTITPAGPTGAAGLALASFAPATAGQHVVTAAAGGAGAVQFQVSAVANRPPVRVAEVLADPGHTIHDTFVRDGIAFVCGWNRGLLLYDVGQGIRGGSPATPMLISRIETASNGVPGGPQVHNAWWFHNPVTGERRYVFVGQEGPGIIGASSSGDIHVVDVSDLADPRQVASLRVPNAGTHNFWMDEERQVLYAAYYNGGVVAVDVSGVLAGDLSGRITAQARPGGAGNTYVWGVQLHGGALWAIDILSGLWKLDPVTLASLGGGHNVPERYSTDFWVHGAFAYTGTLSGRGAPGDQIKVWRIDGAAPVLMDSVRLGEVNLVSDLQVSEDGRLLVATAQSTAASGLFVYSLANPGRPVITGRTPNAVNLHTGALAEIGGRVYVFAARVGGSPALEIWDVTPTP